MSDPRVKKLAQLMIHYSLQIKPGDVLRLRGNVAGSPLHLALYEEALKAGAHVLFRLSLDNALEVFYREAQEDQLTFLPKLTVDEVEFITADIYVDAQVNTKALMNADPKKISKASAARSQVNQIHSDRAAQGDLRWCLTRFPTNAHAQDAGMALDEYEDFVYNALLLNEPDPVAAWRKVHQEQQIIIDYLHQHDEIHIVAPGTDITYRVGGRTWINASGSRNLPDGEVFSAPVEDSVNGIVTFTYPAIYNGNEVEGVVLTFQDGKVVEATARSNEAFLHAMLETDAGARYLGEVAFGTNYGIQKFAKDILFDEKIGGTMHMALGRAYPDCGGKNQSGIHWDIICDLAESQAFADGELFYENGKFKI